MARNVELGVGDVGASNAQMMSASGPGEDVCGKDQTSCQATQRPDVFGDFSLKARYTFGSSGGRDAILQALRKPRRRTRSSSYGDDY